MVMDGLVRVIKVGVNLVKVQIKFLGDNELQNVSMGSKIDNYIFSYCFSVVGIYIIQILVVGYYIIEESIFWKVEFLVYIFDF